MNILYISEISPFPINGGERIRTYGLIKCFSLLDYKVTAIVGNINNISFSEYQTKYELRNTRFIKYNANNTSSIAIASGYFTQNQNLTKLIHQVNLSEIDVVFLDYCFLGNYINVFKKYNIPVIYGTHNAQALLTKQSIKATLYLKIKNYINFILQSLHERIYFNRADIHISTCKNDLLYHQSFVDKFKLKCLPNFLDKNLYDPTNINKENYIIITANFTAFQNFYGLEWFIKHVWNNELSESTTLKLVGKGSEGILDKITSTHKNNIEEIGEVDSIVDYIKNSKVSIIPLQHGSGTRLKCLEAMALKTIVLSTELGVEGIDHHGCVFTENDPYKFRQLLLKILNNFDSHNQVVEQAYNILLSKYSVEANINRIQMYLKTSIRIKKDRLGCRPSV